MILPEDWEEKDYKADVFMKQGQGSIASFGMDYVVYSDLFKRTGDRLKAQEDLGKAIGLFKECSADGWVERTEKTLVALS